MRGRAYEAGLAALKGLIGAEGCGKKVVVEYLSEVLLERVAQPKNAIATCRAQRRVQIARNYG